jgi:xanthine dehydrogenase accessory factor
MSIEVIKKSEELVSARRAFAIATVVRVEGSSSARIGSQAIINAEGKIIAGWIGGGCAESAVRAEALSCLASGQPQLITLDMTDELLGVGMPCGGVMDVYIQPVLPKPELLIVGHGRIAETLAGIGRLMNFAVIVDDPAADRVAFPDADRLITNDLDLTEAAIGPQTYIVIATQHKGDHVWLQKALESDAAYVAMISSHHRAALVLDYLALAGVPREKLDRVRAPAGLDLGAATPEEIALAVMSEIVAARRGANGGPLHRKEADATDTPSDAQESPSHKTISRCDTDPAD